MLTVICESEVVLHHIMYSRSSTVLYSYCLVLFILAVSICLINGEFMIGKVLPSNFDLLELNGYYKPKDAAKICDNHNICAGFTYRGLFNSTQFPNKKYETYFFRYIHQIIKDAHVSNWVTYKTQKTFAEYLGVFNGKSRSINKGKKDILKVCNNPDCAAITIRNNDTTIEETFRTIDISLDNFLPKDDIKTLFNLKVDDAHVKEKSNSMNLCCPPHEKSYDVKKLLDEFNDTLPRISCNISAEEFMESYVIKQRPVILKGCIDDWPSTKTWTFQRLLNKYGNDKLWKVDVSIGKDEYLLKDIIEQQITTEEQQFYNPSMTKASSVKSFANLNLSGERILELMKSNASVRVFERIGVPPRRKDFIDETSKKSDLFQDWHWPKPFPQDLYKTNYGGSDYQWIIMSEKQTGTHIHHDPEITDAWNALLYGHKYWVILPKGAYGGNYECDMRCSQDLDELFVVSWYKHVLPQLRKETWYGKSLIEAIQGPGDVIFVPNGMAHAVLNMDENLSITENFLSLASIDELAQYYAYNWNPLSYESEGVAKRLWRNILNNKENKNIRKYAKEILKQVKSIDYEAKTNFDFFDYSELNF